MLLIIIFIVLSFLLSLQLRPMPIAVGACSNATKTTQKYDTAPSEYNDDAFQEKWPSIKAKLCPNSIPSYQQFGKTISLNEGENKCHFFLLAKNDVCTPQ